MKKIIITGNDKLSNLIFIFEDIMKKVNVKYEIEEESHLVTINVFDNGETTYYAIANVDHELKDINLDIPLCRFITLGFNKKSSVTISSLGGDLDTSKTLIYCIQREIDEDDTIIEPQEFPVFIKSSWGHDIYNIMSAVTAVMLIDRSISDKLNSM
ncbi:hypothetical protein [Vallitalea guaymasensis]|uniref:Uncharacterized protein n=1 Tax=Vallitalea guaymasensis TaxID=1185412 RepID=A0A8J8M8V5_9FIRM|nr:hypothetical protein [Vallitalea guaymasensis]QUH28260.1 hypothetical protein HYG85_04745 [Vallitalea guaymasensis]